MTVSERRNQIIECLNRDGEIKITEIIEMFGVSDVTARSDLASLETMGLLKRVHGGATHTTKTLHTLSQQGKMDANKDEKERIAQAIDELVVDRTSLFISNGTTNVYVARALAKKSDLTIMTNSMSVINVFRESRNMNVLFFGGVYNYAENVTYGNDTIALIDKYSPNLAIISVDGVSAERGISIYNLQEVDVYKQMLRCAKKVILAADHSKIGNNGLAEIGGVTDVDMIVTTKEASQTELDKIRKRGVEIIQV